MKKAVDQFCFEKGKWTLTTLTEFGIIDNDFSLFTDGILC